MSFWKKFQKEQPRRNLQICDINRLPEEVLEIIFNEISSLKDLQQCYNTCTQWRRIIRDMFKDNCKYSC